MATPSIQTLITQAQQVLNLQSSNEIRATLAAVLANANVGTPLNPNLTTQQLWDEFDEIVRQSTDDIMSIIVDQMMRMVFSPPAPGGVGADKQVIFNDMGVLAGDAGLVYNKTTDALTVTGLVTAGSATITGAATVGTTLGVTGVSTLASAVVTGALTSGTTTLVAHAAGYTGKVGIGTATPAEKLDIFSSAGTAAIKLQTAAYIPFTLNSQIPGVSNNGFSIYDVTASANRLTIDSSGNVNVVGGNLVMGTSGKGIDFSATASGSGTMTSELLNDYEEGTWTPTDASGAGLTFTVTACRYTKVGRLVTVQGSIQYPVTASGLTTSWGGFPFNAGDIFALKIIYTDASVATLTYISSNTVNAFLLTPGVNVQNITVSGKLIVFSGTYMI